MRKADREIKNIEEIIDIIKRCDVIRLAFNNGDYPYILPLNFGFEFIENKVIFYFLILNYFLFAVISSTSSE